MPTENTEDPIAALIEDLRSSGADVARSGTVFQPFFSAQGRVLNVNGESVQVFAYATAEEATAEEAYIDPDGDSFKTDEMAGIITWVAAPHFFRKDQLLILYVGDSEAILEALKRLLGSQFAGK